MVLTHDRHVSTAPRCLWSHKNRNKTKVGLVLLTPRDHWNRNIERTRSTLPTVGRHDTITTTCPCHRNPWFVLQVRWKIVWIRHGSNLSWCFPVHVPYSNSLVRWSRCQQGVSTPSNYCVQVERSALRSVITHDIDTRRSCISRLPGCQARLWILALCPCSRCFTVIEGLMLTIRMSPPSVLKSNNMILETQSIYHWDSTKLKIKSRTINVPNSNSIWGVG